MKRIGRALLLGGALAACSDNNGPGGLARLVVAPVLDSIYVGDSLPARTVAYYDDRGARQDPGPVRWSSGNPNVIQVDGATGKVQALAAGFAGVLVEARGLQGAALVVVSRPLQITLLLDSLVLMPADTLTVPVHVQHRAAGTPLVWFSAATNAVFSIDSATGKDSAQAAGGPVPFIAHAALGADTVTDSGTVEVVSLSDTVGGKAAFTIFGTVIRSARMAARAANYRRRGDTLTFRLRAFLTQNATTVEALVVTLRTPVTAPGAFAIDSISPAEAFGLEAGADPVCRPVRNWGSWSTLATVPRLDALSRPDGQIAITRVVPVPNGLAIGGRFSFRAQRFDMYDDSLGVLPIRGTFVAPLVTNVNFCG